MGLACDAFSLATDCPSDPPHIVIYNEKYIYMLVFCFWHGIPKTLGIFGKIRVIKMSFVIHNKSLSHLGELMLISDFWKTLGVGAA